MMSRFEDIRGRTSGYDSVKIQIYQLRARGLMKKSVEKSGGVNRNQKHEGALLQTEKGSRE